MSKETEAITESLGELKLSDDLFPNYSTVLRNDLPKKDELIIKYLTLLDQYIQATEQLQTDFKDGFINLSRANYAKSSLVKPFGKDCWDNTVKAIKKIRIEEKHELIDVNKEESKEDSKEEEKKEESIMRNRNKSSTNEKNTKVVQKKKYNPINMFGVLVPYPLRQSQQSFNKSLPQMINIVNLRNELLSLESELKISKEYSPGSSTESQATTN